VGARLDNQTSSFAALKAFLEIERPRTGALVYVSFDNEEIGCGSAHGARSSLLQDIAERIGAPPPFWARSVVASTDVGHAEHPTNLAINEPGGAFCLGDGVGYAWNHTRVLGTDNPELQTFREIARKAGIPFSPMFPRNSLRGGSTIGLMCAMKLGVKVVDLGVGLVAMHSIAETGAIRDIEALYRLCLEVANHYFEYE
jgi:aspartyl aminopeptidase